MRLDVLRESVEGYDIVVIDEAQRIRSVGISLKLLVDAKVSARLVITGSSSFQLSGQIGEPLTGRKVTLLMLPVSNIELRPQHNPFELKEKIDEHLIFGMYPEVLTAGNAREKTEVLNEITGSYLLKDLLELERVKSSKVLLDLLRLVAFQIGSEVSLRELGAHLGLDYKTVGRYLDLLEKAFVLFNVRGYSRNLRKEVTKRSKYYFYDTGIRNAIISNFNRPHLRDDCGALWENHLFAERMKKLTYTRISANIFFWRTWDGQEIDMVEERAGRLYGYEFKWGMKPDKRSTRPPKEWVSTYRDAEYLVVSRENYLDFVL